MNRAHTEAPLAGAKFLQPKEVMRLLGYADRASFWTAVKSAGIPFIKISKRKAIFEESAVRGFLDRRTFGRVA